MNQARKSMKDPSTMPTAVVETSVGPDDVRIQLRCNLDAEEKSVSNDMGAY